MANTTNKRARAEEARRRSEENLARELARVRTQRIVVISLVVVAVGLFTWALFWIINSQDAVRADADVELYSSGELTVPTVVDDTGGILVGTTGIAGQDAPSDPAVRVDAFEDLLCPNCGLFEFVNKDDLDDLREAGVIELYIHPISILDYLSAGGDYPTRASAASYTVAEYAPEQFADFYSSLFASQPPENTVGLTNTQIAEVARLSGVPEDVIARFKDGEFTLYVASATNDASVAGVRGTPTIWFDSAPYEGNWSVSGQLRADIEFLAGLKEATEGLDDGTTEPAPEPSS